MSNKITLSEALGSINAMDEIAISRAFGQDITDLQRQPFMFMRACAFVVFRREGMTHDEAKNRAFELTISQCNEFFADEPADADLDDENVDPKG